MNPSNGLFTPKNVLIVGLARNCAHIVSQEIAHLRQAITAEENVYILVIESDSEDGTFAALTNLKKCDASFRAISLGKLAVDYPIRTQRIARCRNEYLKELRNNPLYKDVDYVVVADLDGVNNLLTNEAYLSCWQRSDWDVCTANQKGPYYDIWALRHPVWCPNDCWQQHDFLVKHGVKPEYALYAAVHSKMITIDKSADWIDVDSAFGGLAIYRRRAIESVDYVGLTHDGKEVCEHVSLHSKIRSQGYRIYINPKLINASCVEHAKRISPFYVVARKIKRLLGLKK